MQALDLVRGVIGALARRQLRISDQKPARGSIPQHGPTGWPVGGWIAVRDLVIHRPVAHALARPNFVPLLILAPEQDSAPFDPRKTEGGTRDFGQNGVKILAGNDRLRDAQQRSLLDRLLPGKHRILVVLKGECRFHPNFLHARQSARAERSSHVGIEEHQAGSFAIEREGDCEQRRDSEFGDALALGAANASACSLANW